MTLRSGFRQNNVCRVHLFHITNKQMIFLTEILSEDNHRLKSPKLMILIRMSRMECHINLPATLIWNRKPEHYGDKHRPHCGKNLLTVFYETRSCKAVNLLFRSGQDPHGEISGSIRGRSYASKPVGTYIYVKDQNTFI